MIRWNSRAGRGNTAPRVWNEAGTDSLGHGGRALRGIGVLALTAVAFVAAAGEARAQGNYNVVAQMELGAPTSSSFVLHGTIPVPPGTFPRQDGRVPFSIVDSNGTVVDTQMEVVTRYPKDSDGADVVEVLGRVSVPANTPAGTRLLYKVIDHLHTPTPAQVHPTAASLLSNPGTILVVAKDCFGNSYSTELSPGAPATPSVTVTTLKAGAGAKQTLVYGTMMPQTSNIGAPSGALQHLFGVHGYFTSWAGEEVISLDMRVNNGASGLDPATNMDNPLGVVYFQSLELWVKNGWNLLQQAPGPMFGSSRSQGNYTAYSIIEPNADGTLHYMPSQGQFVRRLALCKIGQEAKANSLLDSEGQAFCKRGNSPTSGQELFSWWNPLTARYYPQRHRLPELDHLGGDAIRLKLKNQHAIIHTALTTGAAGGCIGVPNQGWAHPWGAKYGGMTGGSEVFLFDGFLVAEGASNEGWRATQLTHRAYMDRQPDALYNKDGRPTELSQWLQQGPNGPYVNMYFYGRLLAGNDPFGFKVASKHQVTWVTANNKKPAYQTLLAAFSPVDLQHVVRTTRSMKTLAWLGNDSLAKDDLRSRAEIFRLSYHQYPNNSTNKAQGGGLLDSFRAVTNTPGAGFKIGRAQGWGLDTVNAAYALGDSNYRQSVLPWYGVFTRTLSLGQVACNGYIQSQVSNKQLNGLYYMHQQYEMSILENGMRGAIESVLRGVDPTNATTMTQVLDRQIQGMISPQSWDPVKKGPWKNLAMAALNDPTTPFCNFVPPGGTSPGVEKYQNWSSYAYGYEISHNQNLLNFAKTQMGGDLLTAIKAKKFKDLEQRLALLALLQRP